MKINTKIALKNLKGEELKIDNNMAFTLGDALSEILAAAKSGGKMKLYILAQKVVMNEIVEVDSADLALIKATTEGSDRYLPLITGQVLVLLDEIK